MARVPKERSLNETVHVMTADLRDNCHNYSSMASGGEPMGMTGMMRCKLPHVGKAYCPLDDCKGFARLYGFC
jgi:hypothetical protein